MSTAAYNRIESLHGYEHALRYLNATAPIKGKRPIVRPLAARKDASRFSIRMVGDADSLPEGSYYKQLPGVQDGDIECLLFDHPLVVFHKPREGDDPNVGRITVASVSTWLAISDCYFIHNVLYEYFASVQRAHKSVAKLFRRAYGDKELFAPIVFPCPTKNGEVTTLEMIVDKNESKVLWVKGAPVEGLRLNRTAANIVRAKYGDFYRYAKGMIALRRQKADHDEGYHVRFEPSEFGLAGMQLDNRGIYLLGYRNPVDKPAKDDVMRHYGMTKDQHRMYEDIKVYPDWESSAKQYIERISASVTDPDQTEKFAVAFTLLAAYARLVSTSPYGRGIRSDRPTIMTPKDLTTTLDEIVFKYHSSEVIEAYLMPEGYVPNPKYKTWVDR